MKEQFVTYEIALKLKELGFDEQCFGLYKNEILYRDYETFQFFDFSNCIKAPLWQQVIDWFREKQNMYIEITYEGGLQKDTSLYSFQIWSNKAREQAILKAIELCQNKKS